MPRLRLQVALFEQLAVFLTGETGTRPYWPEPAVGVRPFFYYYFLSFVPEPRQNIPV